MKIPTSLSCRECRREYSISRIHVSEFCFEPAGVFCSYAKIKKDSTVRKFRRKTQIYEGGRNGSPCSSPCSVEEIG
jgi:hypothetical protein